MPLSFDESPEDHQQAAAEDADAESLSTHNPLAPTARTQAFCDFVLMRTENNSITVDREEFVRLQEEFGRLEGFEKFAAQGLLAQKGITWAKTLEWEKDGWEDELNGYDVYVKLRAEETNDDCDHA
jgi:hypothetical protein